MCTWIVRGTNRYKIKSSLFKKRVLDKINEKHYYNILILLFVYIRVYIMFSFFKHTIRIVYILVYDTRYTHSQLLIFCLCFFIIFCIFIADICSFKQSNERSRTCKSISFSDSDCTVSVVL